MAKSKNTNYVNAAFDNARHNVWEMFMAIMHTIDPDYEEPEPK